MESDCDEFGWMWDEAMAEYLKLLFFVTERHKVITAHQMNL
jgi:hypothetical protein